MATMTGATAIASKSSFLLFSHLGIRTLSPPIFSSSMYCPQYSLAITSRSPSSISSSLLDPHFRQSMVRNPSYNEYLSDTTLVASCSAGGDAVLSGFPEEAWPPEAASEPALSQPLVKRKAKEKKLIAGVDQSELVDPWLLADPDGRFVEFYGLQVHYKIAQPSSEGYPGEAFAAAKANVSSVSSSQPSEAAESSWQTNIGIPAICLHGFGASVFSWEKVLQPLANCLGSQVVAFDRPAFGLTSRPHPVNCSSQGQESLSLNPYSLGFSAKLSLAFIGFLKADKAILVGHSAGCIVAAQAYLDSPEQIAAIVMVAPAILAPFLKKSTDKGEPSKQKGNAVSMNDREVQGNKMLWFKDIFLGLWAAVVWLHRRMMSLVQGFTAVMSTLYRNMLKAVLRSRPAIFLLRFIMDKGGRWIVQHAWYDKEKADKRVIEGYTKPLKCRNWETALLEYVLALVASPTDNGQGKLGERLTDIKCPVLVITGDTDRLVPSFNAERLASSFPKSQFQLIKNCGHLPHEEKPDEFLAIIRNFVTWIRNTDSNFSFVHV